MDSVQASEEKYRGLFGAAFEAIVLIDLQDGLVLDANEAAAQLYGYEPSELCGLPAVQLSIEPDKTSQILRELHRTGGSRQGTRLQRRKDGTVFPADGSLAQFHLGDRSLAVAVVRDISARVQSETELRTQQTRLELLTQQMPAVLWTVDHDLRYTSTRGAALAILGLTPDQTNGHHIEDFDVDPGYVTVHRRALEGQASTFSSQYQARTFHSYVQPLRDATGDIVGAIGVALDITDRLTSEELLRHVAAGVSADVGESFFQSLVQLLASTLSVDHVFIGELLPASRSAVRTLAMCSHGVRVPDVEYDLADTPCANVMSGDLCTFQRGVQGLFPHDGMLVQLHIEAYVGIPLRDSSGKTLGLMALMHGRPLESADKAESLLRILAARAAAELERRRTERERLAAEEQLRHAQRMEAVGRLAGGVAHDYNNMLAVILGYSSMLLEQPELSPALRKMVVEIHRAADRSARLTDQLLAFSRKHVLKTELIDVNDVLRGLERMLRPLLGEDVDIGLDVASDLDFVKADVGQLEQIVSNLAVNSRDAMPDGGPLRLSTRNVVLDEEYVRSHPSAVPGPYVQMVVEDRGTGMDADVLSHIFEPFFTTKEQGKGTGLGLSTVYAIVTASGGHLDVRSELGKGTRVAVYLPAVARSASDTSVAPQSHPHAVLEGQESILLVEDENMLRGLARHILEARGYRVVAMAEPEEAIRYVVDSGEPIHLLLTDVVMPQMSGPDLAEHLRPLRPQLKVLFMSGYTSHPAIERSLQNDEADFLPKPFTPDVLARKVRHVLDR